MQGVLVLQLSRSEVLARQQQLQQQQKSYKCRSRTFMEYRIQTLTRHPPPHMSCVHFQGGHSIYSITAAVVAPDTCMYFFRNTPGLEQERQHFLNRVGIMILWYFMWLETSGSELKVIVSGVQCEQNIRQSTRLWLLCSFQRLLQMQLLLSNNQSNPTPIYKQTVLHNHPSIFCVSLEVLICV